MMNGLDTSQEVNVSVEDKIASSIMIVPVIDMDKNPTKEEGSLYSRTLRL